MTLVYLNLPWGYTGWPFWVSPSPLVQEGLCGVTGSGRSQKSHLASTCELVNGFRFVQPHAKKRGFQDLKPWTCFYAESLRGLFFSWCKGWPVVSAPLWLSAWEPCCCPATRVCFYCHTFWKASRFLVTIAVFFAKSTATPLVKEAYLQVWLSPCLEQMPYFELKGWFLLI